MSLRPQPLRPLELELPATPRSAATARNAITQFCADQAVDHGAVMLAVSEAVANAVVHAYRDRQPGPVRVTASFEDHALHVVVSDDGTGMKPRTDSPGMGMGLALIARLSTSVQIDGDGDGTRVSMRFQRDV